MIPIKIDPIPLKERSPYIAVEYGTIDVEDGGIVIRDCNGIRTRIPIGILSCLMLGPGTSITHAAVKLAAEAKCLLLWIGENGVRQYSAGTPGGARCDRLLKQARAALDENLRLDVVRMMYQYRFNESFENLSIEQMRGKEAARVKGIYRQLSEEFGVEWKGRRYDANRWQNSDCINKCLSSATSCLYGITESAILISGYSPAIGFIHTGRPRSFVFDIADMIKYETVVPIAFKVASSGTRNPESETRHECRDMFGKEKILEKLIPMINSLFNRIEVAENGVVDAPEVSVKDGCFYDGADY